jgi:YHS domain-containing protein
MATWNWITILAVAVVIAYVLLRRRRRSRSHFVDPVCGMAVTPARAHATRFGPRGPIYLCSQRCVEMFDVSPARYGGVTPHRGAHVGC